jgi:PAS domain S-box-containing protein
MTLPDYKRYIQKFGVHSYLMVPIKGRNNILGTLGITRDQGGQAYTTDDQALLMDIAQRTALAIDHCLLVDSLRSEISDRRNAEKALEESEIRFRSIFESTALGVKVIDPEGNLLQVNPAFQKIVGYSNEELSGKHFASFIHPLDSAESVRRFELLLTKAEPNFRLEHRIVHKDGSIVWVNATFTPVYKNKGDGSPVFIVGITENITGRKQIELEMAEMKNRLQDNVEMERLRLAQEMHDGPMQELYSAIYQIEELRRRVIPEQQETLEMLKSDLQKILSDLRSTAKELRPPSLAAFGLEKAIRSHIEDLREKYPSIHYHLTLAQDGQNLPESVRLALFRIYQQSLSNVIRHAEATQVRVRFSFNHTQTVLEIKDNGKGFEVPNGWVQLTREGHFGLAGAAERVRALDGVFTVESHPGKGTTVRVRIPCPVHSE